MYSDLSTEMNAVLVYGNYGVLLNVFAKEHLADLTESKMGPPFLLKKWAMMFGLASMFHSTC